MKNTVNVFILIFIVISFFLLNILGSKTRIGYLSDFNLDVNRTLKINSIGNDFIKNNNEAYKRNFILTNSSITNYIYDCKINYYSKIFKNSDIYDVYLDTNYIKNLSYILDFDQNKTRYITFTSSKIINYSKIDDIRYYLVMNKYIKYLFFIFISFLIIFLISPYISNFIYNKLSPIEDINNNITNIQYNNELYTHIFIFSFIISFYFYFVIDRNISLTIPYSYMWESNVFIQDLLLVNSNLMQDTFVIPAITNNLIYKFIFIPLANFLNLLSFSNIEELKNFLNPYLAYKEFIDYVFISNSFIMFLYSLIMYINVFLIIKDVFSKVNKILIYLLSLSIALYLFIYPHYLFIYHYRPEPTGLLFNALAFFFIIKASKTQNYNYNILYIILSAFCIGLAFFSKLLFIAGIIFIPFMYFTLRENCFYDKKINFVNRAFYIFLFISITLIIFNIILSNFVRNDKIIDSAFYYRTLPNFKRNVILGLFIFPTIMTFCTLFLFLIKIDKIKILDSMKEYIYYISIYSFVLIFSILITILLPQNIYSLFNSYLFSFGFITSTLPVAENSAAGNLKSTYIILVFLIVSFLSLLFFIILKIKTYYNNRKLFISLLALNITLIISCILSRAGLNILYGAPRDALVISIIIFINIIILFRYILLNIKYKNILIFFLSILLIYISYLNIKGARNLYNNKKALSSYETTIDEWFQYSYGKRSALYTRIMNNIYTSESSRNATFYLSFNSKQLQNVLNNINKDIKLKDTITSVEKTFLDLSKTKQITTLSPKFKGGILVPLTQNHNNVNLRLDYDFYLVSENPLKEKDNRIIDIKDHDFKVNNTNYNIYLLTMKSWREAGYGNYNGRYNFKLEDIGDAYILIKGKE